jgi:hypothetical protein
MRMRTILVAGLLLAWCGPLLAQGRKNVGLTTPALRGLNVVGGDFSTYSYGLGGVRPAGLAGSDVLRSSVYTAPMAGLGVNYATLPKVGSLDSGDVSSVGNPLSIIRRTPMDSAISSLTWSGPSGSEGLLSSLSSDVFKGMKSPLSESGANPMAPPVAPARATKVGAFAVSLQSYVISGTKPPLSAVPAEDTPVKTLAPQAPSDYRTRMLTGETALREGRYADAVDAFTLAEAMAGTSPEPLLDMVAAQAGLGRYHEAAYNLRQTYSIFPELPASKLQWRSFYPPDQFDKLLAEMRGSAQGGDADATLLLAYFQHCDGQADQARESFNLAIKNGDAEVQQVAKAFLALPPPSATQPAAGPSSQPGILRP